MENTKYEFSGYTFGDKGYYNLIIRVINPNKEVGTSYSTEIALELNTDERMELIKNLITLNAKADN